ncbi:hypothetical protein Vretimale_6799 [Volvox reticuliferus]|nr:hypothetical protein Vretimale_6799 [Volvox reticuliferus]
MLRIPEEDIKDLCEHYPELLRGLRKLDVLRQARAQERLAAIKEQLESSSKHSAPPSDREGSALLGGKQGSFSITSANGSAGSVSGLAAAAKAGGHGGSMSTGTAAAAAAAATDGAQARATDRLL